MLNKMSEYKQVLEDCKNDYQIMRDYQKRMMLENKEMHDTSIIHPRIDTKKMFNKKGGPTDEEFKQYMKEKFTCKCGGSYTRKNPSAHKKSIKHKKWLEEKI